MENRQIHSNSEIKVLDKGERLDRVLKYEVNLPDDISTLSVFQEVMRKPVLSPDEITKIATQKALEGVKETQYYEAIPDWRGGFGFAKIKIGVRYESVFIAGSSIKSKDAGKRYEGIETIYFSGEDLRFGPKPKGGEGWSLNWATTDAEKQKSIIQREKDTIAEKIKDNERKLREPQLMQESWHKFVEDWIEIKEEVEDKFSKGETYKILEVKDQRYLLKFYGDDILSGVDPKLGPTIERNGNLEVCILGYEDGVKVNAMQVKQGWENVELGHKPFQRHDIEDRKAQTLKIAMYKNRINFEIEYDAKFENPRLQEFPNTVLVAQDVKVVTPVGEVTKELRLFDARKAEISSDLPSNGIDIQIREASNRYLEILGISPELVKQIFEDNIDVNSISNFEEAIDLYIKIKNECGKAKDFDQYDHQAHILKVVSDLLNSDFASNFYSTISSFTYESNDGMGIRSDTNIHYYADSKRIDGKSDVILGNSSLKSETVKKIEEARLLWDQNWGYKNGERKNGPAMTIDQRIELAKILLENEFSIKNPTESIQHSSYEDGVYHHLLWWKQYEILQKAFELTGNIDFSKSREVLLNARKTQFDDVKKWMTDINNDESVKGSYYNSDGSEEFHERNYHLGMLSSRIVDMCPSINSNTPINELTDNDAKDLYKAKTYILDVLSQESIKDEYVFGDPILPIGKRTIARLDKLEDRLVLKIDNVPSDHWEIKKIMGDLAPHKLKQKDNVSTFVVEADFNKLQDLWTKIALQEGAMDSIKSGEYPVKIIEVSRKGHDYWKILVLTPEYLEKEKLEILAELKQDIPLRKLAKEISGENGLFGMPVDKEGMPCDEDEADHWVMYMEYHKWANAYPDAYVMFPMKGYRSKSTGNTFEALVKEYKR